MPAQLIKTLKGLEITDGIPQGTDLKFINPLDITIQASDVQSHSVEFWENETTDDPAESDEFSARQPGDDETNDFLKVDGETLYNTSDRIVFRNAFVRTEDGGSSFQTFAIIKVSASGTATDVHNDSVFDQAEDRVFMFVANLQPAGISASEQTFEDTLDGTELSNLWLWSRASSQDEQLYTRFGNANIPCFTSGTYLEGADGPVLVEDVSAGDSLLTQCDTGGVSAVSPSRVAWSFKRHLNADELREKPELYPVRIVAGALGDGVPKRDLLVSRQHRVLVRSKVAERMFGASEVLVAAIKLVDLPGIFVDTDVTEIDYFHLLFNEHKIVFAEGAPVESLYLGDEALTNIGADALAELLEIFGDEIHEVIEMRPVRTIPKGKLQKNLISRHAKNQKPIWAVEV